MVQFWIGHQTIVSHNVRYKLWKQECTKCSRGAMFSKTKGGFWNYFGDSKGDFKGGIIYNEGHGVIYIMTCININPINININNV